MRIDFLMKYVAAVGLCSLGILAQAQGGHSQADALAWMKSYATDCGAAMHHPCPSSANGYENEFNGDPRLPGVLKAALPQPESWWVNGPAGSVPVSSIVQEFLGVPGKLWVDAGRYVTATGCVPRFCPDHGMLWIDTGTHPAEVIFAGEDQIQDFTSASIHLWIYGSSNLNFEALPPDFLANLNRWHKANIDSKYDPQTIALATLVQADGRSHDLTYNMLFFKQNKPKLPLPGASK